MKTKSNEQVVSGLTKKEYFAALAMQALLANSAETTMTPSQCVSLAVIMSEGLIEELNK